jgi:hypothetical protein
MEHRLLVEFFWMLHKIPDYLIRSDVEDCGSKLRYMGKRMAGIQELWNLMGGDNCAGVQTLRRKMALQLGWLEREGLIRLDQVRNTPSRPEMDNAYQMLVQSMQAGLTSPTAAIENRAQTLLEE